MDPTIELVNHASIVIDSSDGTRVLTDPWLDGIVFNRGWALLSPSLFSADDFGSITHLWISHEHPDHFHPPTLRRIPERYRQKIVVLHQISPNLAGSHEIKDFCVKLGFRDFIELSATSYLSLGPNLRILCRHHMWGDSWSHFLLPLGPDGKEWTIFNSNDCEWETTAVAEQVISLLGAVDVLLMQYSYACWYPDQMSRRREADRLMDRLAMMTKTLRARYVVPFASAIWFCHEENYHMNEDINTISRAVKTIERDTSAKAVVLYPGDVWRIGSQWDNEAALRKYAVDYERTRQASLIRAEESVSLEDLTLKLAAFWNRNCILGKDNRSGPNLRLFVRDLRQALLWTGLTLEPVRLSERECDLSLSSDSLAYMFDTRWGTTTLSVNARFTLPESRFRNLIEIELAIVRALGRNNWLGAGSFDTNAFGPVPGVTP